MTLSDNEKKLRALKKEEKEYEEMTLSDNEKKLKALEKEEKEISEWFSDEIFERKRRLSRKGDIGKEMGTLARAIKIEKGEAYRCSLCNGFVDKSDKPKGLDDYMARKGENNYMDEGICFICMKVRDLKDDKEFLVGATITELEVDGNNITGLRLEKDGKKYYLYSSGEVDSYDGCYDADYYMNLGDDGD